MSPSLLEMHNVCKSFPGVQALVDVDFNVQKGEVHVLLGENGAGKSTLIKILSGVYSQDKGSLLFKGQDVHFENPSDAQRLGISVIYQEPSLIPELSVAENVFLGNEPGLTSLPAVIDQEQMVNGTQAVFDELNLPLDPLMRVSELRLPEQQMVAIARALRLSAELIVMDEPTSMLPQPDVAQLLSVIRRLRARGVGIVYVTHRLEEALLIGDRATILRDGQSIATLSINETTQADLIRLIVGRGIEETFSRRNAFIGAEVLRLDHVSSGRGITDASFSLHVGEIIGVTGLVGAGGTDLLHILFGMDPVTSGTLFMDGQPVTIKSPQQAISLGIGLLTEDRQEQGLVLEMNALENITLTSLKNISAGPVIDHNAENNIGRHYAHRMNIRLGHLASKALHLSGGTQQKLILSRWLASRCRVLLLDEPTRGVDVSSRLEFYHLLNELSRRGTAMILVSSNLAEILSLSDHILVLRRGQVMAMCARSETNPSSLLALANGGMQA